MKPALRRLRGVFQNSSFNRDHGFAEGWSRCTAGPGGALWSRRPSTDIAATDGSHYLFMEVAGVTVDRSRLNKQRLPLGGPRCIYEFI